MAGLSDFLFLDFFPFTLAGFSGAGDFFSLSAGASSGGDASGTSGSWTEGSGTGCSGGFFPRAPGVRRQTGSSITFSAAWGSAAWGSGASDSDTSGGGGAATVSTGAFRFLDGGICLQGLPGFLRQFLPGLRHQRVPPLPVLSLRQALGGVPFSTAGAS